MKQIIKINYNQIYKVSEFLTSFTEMKPFDFYSIQPGIIYPEKDSDFLLDYFFFTTLHQFGFWYNKDNHYTKPFYDAIKGNRLKGSDYMWSLVLNAYYQYPEIFELNKLRNVSFEEYKDIFSNDNGEYNIPMGYDHYKLSVGYADDLLRLELTPRKIIKQLLIAAKPIKELLSILSKITGYKEDPLLKKASLLSIILINRPEKIIDKSHSKSIQPVVDYHIMRSLLRIGLIEITDNNILQANTNRKLITQSEEKQIRYTAYKTILFLKEKSKRNIDEIDYFFFLNRKRCPEMDIPVCKKCPVNEICKKRIDLFQPLIRTTYY